GNGMGHIDLSRGADAIVVAPASADFIAKVAQGHADDLLSTLCCARDVRLLVAPAMNRQMWSNAATQRNVQRLRDDGVMVSGPDALATPTGVARVDVQSAADMAKAVDARVAECDVFIGVAAVADYTVAAPAAQKVKKRNEPLTITLQPTVDILASVAAR